MLFRPKNIAFGLDIGDKSVKIAEIKLVKNLRGQQSLILMAFNEMPLPESVIINGEIKNIPAVVDAIKQCIQNANGKFLTTTAVVASLPESQSYYKIITLPPKQIGDLNDFISKAMHRHFPISEGDLYGDWQYISKNQIAIGAAPKNIIDSYTNVIEQAGFIPLALEIEGISISRALLPRVSINGAAKNKIFMDLGATRSSIIATQNNTPILTLNIPLAGNKITQNIAKIQKITFEEAEKIKKQCALDFKKCPPRTKKVIDDEISLAVEKLKTGIQYVNRYLKQKIDKLYICGGVSLMPKLTTILSQKIGIKVRHADPLMNIQIDKRLKIPEGELLKYTTVIGLAMRGTESDVVKIK